MALHVPVPGPVLRVLGNLNRDEALRDSEARFTAQWPTTRQVLLLVPVVSRLVVGVPGWRKWRGLERW
eukprot:1773826-Rhodomonas_salina.1